MSVAITVCITCKFAPDRPFSEAGRTGGALLADAVETEARNRSNAPRIVRHACLWACSQSCAILIESGNKTGYLAGRFEPTDEAAQAILDWAAAYGESDAGEVRYARWPEGMKGHFAARIPVMADAEDRVTAKTPGGGDGE